MIYLMGYTALLLLLLLSQAIAIRGQSKVNVQLPDQNPFKQMLPLDLCEVTHNPRRYEGKAIRVRAIVNKTFERSGLVPYESQDCWDWMSVTYDCPDEGACRQFVRETVDALKVFSIPVVVSGHFKYRHFITAEEMRWGRHIYELIITSVDEVSKPRQKSGAEPKR